MGDCIPFGYAPSSVMSFAHLRRIDDQIITQLLHSREKSLLVVVELDLSFCNLTKEFLKTLLLIIVDTVTPNLRVLNLVGNFRDLPYGGFSVESTAQESTMFFDQICKLWETHRTLYSLILDPWISSTHASYKRTREVKLLQVQLDSHRNQKQNKGFSDVAPEKFPYEERIYAMTKLESDLRSLQEKKEKDARKRLFFNHLFKEKKENL